MPKLGQQYDWILNLPFFLYPTIADAEAGNRFGGTGFLVTIEDRGMEIPFAVTNAHIAFGDKINTRSGVIRANGRDGQVRLFETHQDDWFTIPGLYDIAVMPAHWATPDLKIEALALSPLRDDSFYIDDALIREREINAGDDVFMVGRFVNVDGRQGNQPALRFGNISIMDASVHHPLGFQGRSVILDMRSRSGFSGSPVFVYRTAGSIFGKPNTLVGGGHFLKLLGIHWYQFPERWNLGETPFEVPSAMTAIHPTKSIVEVIQAMCAAA